VALVSTDVSEERIASNIMVKIISELGTTLGHCVLQLLVTVNVVPRALIIFILTIEVIHYSETSILTRATWCYIPEEGILLNCVWVTISFDTEYGYGTFLRNV
jgi:hypothetical protein